MGGKQSLRLTGTYAQTLNTSMEDEGACGERWGGLWVGSCHEERRGAMHSHGAKKDGVINEATLTDQEMQDESAMTEKRGKTNEKRETRKNAVFEKREKRENENNAVFPREKRAKNAVFRQLSMNTCLAKAAFMQSRFNS